MKPAPSVLSSFDRCWNEFALQWKKVRSKAAEKSVHDLRVSSRRLTSALEIVRVFSRSAEASKAKRRLKRVLKSSGDLRDLQVYWKKLDALPETDLLRQFKRDLERRSRRETHRLYDDLTRSAKQSLKRDFQKVRSQFERSIERSGEAGIRRSLDRSLKARQNEFAKTARRIDPDNEEALHKMRIALKKFRYTTEAAEFFFEGTAGERLEKMRELQKYLGEWRDLQLLRFRLEKWASKRGKVIAMAPLLDRFAEERDNLVPKIIQSTAVLKESFSPVLFTPAVEKTTAVAEGKRSFQKTAV